MSKKSDIKKTYFPLRVNNYNTLTFIEELMQTGNFDSRNELLNICINNGILELAKEHLRHRKGEATEQKKSKSENTESTNIEILHRLKQIENTTDELFIMQGLFEHMITTLFNVTAEQLDGEPVVKDDMVNGRLSDLPEHLQDIKDELIKRYYKN